MQSDKKALKASAKLKKVLIYKFDDSEKLFEYIEKLFQNKTFKNANSDLYKLENFYYLIIRTNIKTSVLPHVSYREHVSLTKYVYVLEHGKRLCRENAVYRIGKALKDS